MANSSFSVREHVKTSDCTTAKERSKEAPQELAPQGAGRGREVSCAGN